MLLTNAKRESTMSDTLRWVRITKTPDGEAPEWVRRQWIGVVLPDEGRIPSGECFGLVTGQKKQGSADDFIVDRETAITALACKSFKAAQWFREQAQSSGTLLFRRDEVEPIPDPNLPPSSPPQITEFRPE